MELKMTALDGKEAGKVTLSDEIFGLEPRKDIIQRCVNWQLAKRRAGTHAVKNRADIARTGKKSGPQKGSGGARHGSQRANLFRGGGRSFGPHPRAKGAIAFCPLLIILIFPSECVLSKAAIAPNGRANRLAICSFSRGVAFCDLIFGSYLPLLTPTISTGKAGPQYPAGSAA